MKVGILKEIKTKENRVAMTPQGVSFMQSKGHDVLVEKNAGVGSGFSDEEYVTAGARIASADEIFEECEMVMHVKEPMPEEYAKIRPGQIIFTYLHLAADKTLTEALIKSGCVGIAYETIQKNDGSLPLLVPMSEIAGRMSIQQAAISLEIPSGGMGKLLGGVPGVEPATVVVIGAGAVGTQAAKMACGLGARVCLLDVNLDRLRHLDDVMPANCVTLMSTRHTIRELLPRADVVIGAVLIPGGKTPQLLTREDLKLMQKGAVLVDVAIDQGGCFETSRPTTHAEPVYTVDGVLHYCVTNIPGAVARTSTLALTNATLPYAAAIADAGWKKAAESRQDIARGCNIVNGKITHKAVSDALDMPYTPLADTL